MKKLLVILIPLLFVSCAKNLGTIEGKEFFEISFGEGKITYSVLKEQLLVGKCQRCHGWVNDESEILARVTAGDPENSDLYLSVKNGFMPQGGPELSSKEKELVARYITDLAVDDSDDLKPEPNPTPIPEPTPATGFALIKEKFFDAKCVKCHKGMATEEGIQKYVVAGKPEESSLFQSVEDDWMPKRGPKLTDEEKSMLYDYIRELAPEPTPVSFMQMKESFFQDKCIRCHRGMADEAKLAEYIIPGNALESPLFKSVENDWMPKRGPKLTDAEKQMMIDYINSL